MFKRIHLSLTDNCQVEPNDILLVGVSGGPDSLFLLDILGHLEYSLIVAHLDHGLRTESSAEMETVRQFAQERGLAFVQAQVDVENMAREKHFSVEEAARTARYGFLFDQAEIHGAQAVVVGHTADDQVETVLMHLFRGAGLAGLGGMAYRSLPNPWSKSKPLLRPLLDIWRDEIMDYLDEHGLQPLYDDSNLDIRFYRNRLRHELIPYLENIHPGLRKKLWRTSQVLRQDYEFLESLVDAIWEVCLSDQDTGFLVFDYQNLGNQPLSLQRLLLRRAIHILRPGIRDVDFETIARATNFINQPSKSQQINLLAGLRLFLEEQYLWLAGLEADLPTSDWPQLEPGTELRLDVPGTLLLRGGWRLQANHEPLSKAIFDQVTSNLDPFHVWLDLNALKFPLTVRTRCAGDRFSPLGMEDISVKLSEFFIDHKLPRRARDGWPLVLSGVEIAWLPGFRPAHTFRLRKDSEQSVHLSLERFNEEIPRKQ